MSESRFDYDANPPGWRYPDFEHDGDRSIILIDTGILSGVLSYVFRATMPYVVQIQGVQGHRPPKRWAQDLLAHLVGSSDEVIVRAAHNNPRAHEFHRWLRSNGIYCRAGLDKPSFGEAIDIDPETRDRIDRIAHEYLVDCSDADSHRGEHMTVSRLHPSTAKMRYDVTAHTVARSLKKRLEELDPQSAHAFSVSIGDWLISG